jgi:hypothetical protein
MVSTWKILVARARMVCFSETHKDLNSWRPYAQNHRGAALRFSCEGGIQRAPAPDSYKSKMFVKSKTEAPTKGMALPARHA